MPLVTLLLACLGVAGFHLLLLSHRRGGGSARPPAHGLPCGPRRVLRPARAGLDHGRGQLALTPGLPDRGRGNCSAVDGRPAPAGSHAGRRLAPGHRQDPGARALVRAVGPPGARPLRPSSSLSYAASFPHLSHGRFYRSTSEHRLPAGFVEQFPRVQEAHHLGRSTWSKPSAYVWPFALPRAAARVRIRASTLLRSPT